MHKVIQNEENIWTVGYHDPDNHWIACYDAESFRAAAAWCSYLNGGLDPELSSKLTNGLKIGGALSVRGPLEYIAKHLAKGGLRNE